MSVPGAELGPEAVVANILLSFVLTIAAAWVYKKTHRGISFSPSFVFTLVLVGPIIAAVMMVIGNSIARAFGAFGAFSIIRFRTAIKDTKDMAFIFWSLALGMAAGTGNYLIAVSTLVAVSVFAFVLAKMKFGSLQRNGLILTLRSREKLDGNPVFEKIAKKHLRSYNTLSLQPEGKGYSYNIEARLSSKGSLDGLAEDLDSVEGISDVDLVVIKDDIEY